MKGFLHTPVGSVLPSEPVSSVTADSILRMDSEGTNKVNICAEGTVLNMTDAVGPSPDSIAVVTNVSELSNQDKADPGSNDKKG